MEKFAIIVQVENSRVQKYSLGEMEGLAESAGYTLCGFVSQSLAHVNPRFFLGRGKMEQLKDYIRSFFDLDDPADVAEQENLAPIDEPSPLWGEYAGESDEGHAGDDSNNHDDHLEGILVPDDGVISGGDLEDDAPDSDSLSPLMDSQSELGLDFPDTIDDISKLTVVFNNRLSYAQITTLSRELEVRVKDRDEIILEIFELNARTHEAKLQIELARMALQTNIMKKDFGVHIDEKQGRDFQGKGLKGWEPQMLAYRRRKKKIQEDLAKISGQRALRRKRRDRMFNVGVVGYTNAGKSTFINTLAGTHLETADHEFTTISPVSRKVTFPQFDEYGNWAGQDVIFTDSVGFIMDMSPMLIDAFLSTLEELQFSDVLLVVVDISDDLPTIQVKLDTTSTVLKRVQAFDLPKLYALNKTDLLTTEEIEKKLVFLKQMYPDIHWYQISAQNKASLAALWAPILEQKSPYDLSH